MLLKKILLGSINVSLIPHPCSPTETEGYIAGRCKRIRRTMVKNILSEFSDHARSSVVDPEAEGGGGAKGLIGPPHPQVTGQKEFVVESSGNCVVSNKNSQFFLITLDKT